MQPTLQYWNFEASDDGEGTGTWEAMASVLPGQLAAALDEAQAVLDWAEAHSPGPRGPLDEGGRWDADLHQSPDGDWLCLSLTLTGPWAWGEALQGHFTSERAGP